MDERSHSLNHADSVPLGYTADGRQVLAIGRVADGLIILVREPSSPTGLRWEDCDWSPDQETANVLLQLVAS